jgi:heme exporter protein A
LLAPTAGRVIYGSDDLVSSDIRSQIGWVSHDTRCYPDLTARQNVELAASLYGVSPSAGWAAMGDRFGVKRFADSPVRQLSRGQRQRVTLARALVHRPALLLLDEPTTGLDTEGISRLLEVIEEERLRGCIVVLVTHDVQIAERVATRRIVLERGRVQMADALREAAPAP